MVNMSTIVKSCLALFRKTLVNMSNVVKNLSLTQYQVTINKVLFSMYLTPAIVSSLDIHQLLCDSKLVTDNQTKTKICFSHFPS